MEVIGSRDVAGNNNSYPNMDVMKNTSNGASLSIEPYLEHRRNHGGQGQYWASTTGASRVKR